VLDALAYNMIARSFDEVVKQVVSARGWGDGEGGRGKGQASAHVEWKAPKDSLAPHGFYGARGLAAARVPTLDAPEVYRLMLDLSLTGDVWQSEHSTRDPGERVATLAKLAGADFRALRREAEALVDAPKPRAAAARRRPRRPRSGTASERPVSGARGVRPPSTTATTARTATCNSATRRGPARSCSTATPEPRPTR
jgi:hypothetical protein